VLDHVLRPLRPDDASAVHGLHARHAAADLVDVRSTIEPVLDPDGYVAARPGEAAAARVRGVVERPAAVGTAAPSGGEHSRRCDSGEPAAAR